MSLLNRAVELEPSKAYSTASKKEMQRRLDRSLGVIERRLAARLSVFEKSKNTLNLVKSNVSSESRLIKEWKEAHAGISRLPARMDARPRSDSAYPWRRNTTAKNFSKHMRFQLSRSRDSVRSSINELRNYVEVFNDRFSFIQKGFSWLRVNPPKVFLASEVQSAFSDLLSIVEIDGVKKLVLKDINVSENGQIVCRDIVSSDSDEMIVSNVSEFTAVRKAAGIEVKDKKIPEGALVGDLIDNRGVFELVGRMTEPGLLDAAIKGHFYKAGIRSIKGVKLTFPDRFALNVLEFDEKRDQATFAYANGNSLDYSRLKIENSTTGWPKLFMKSTYYERGRILLPVKEFGVRAKRAPLERDPRVPLNDNDVPYFYGFQCEHSLRPDDMAYFECNANLSKRIPSVLTGGPGSGKTTLITSYVSAFTLAGGVVKIIGGGGSLDVIEGNIKGNRKLSVEYERFDDYLIVKPNGSIKRSLKFSGDGPHMTIVDEASLIEMRDEFLDPDRILLVVGDLFQIAKPGSVLDWAERAQLPQFMLKKNYRAHNADAMVWSNTFSYETSMIMMAHGERRSGVRYVPLARKVNGIVHSEARAVANAAVSALKDGSSAGVVAFSKKQLSAVLDNMAADDRARLKFAGLPEDVQGKEADHVFISLGAALTAGGKTPIRINGLEDDMGLSRMNVALSRSLYSNTVFSGLSVNDIDLRTSTASQAILLSVLQTHDLLPDQATMENSREYGFMAARVEPDPNY